MDSKYISIAPSNLFLKVGETKQLQINCDFEDKSWSLEVEPEGIVDVDKYTREIKGLKVGYAIITVELHHIKKDGKVIKDKESMIVEVQEGDVVATPIKIMLHNRQTNRLVTMVGDLSDEEYVVKLPNTNGTLLTEEAAEDVENVIAKPSIINVTHYEPNWKKEFIASEFMVRYGRLNETHVKSQWEFALDKHFNEIIHTVEHETGDLKKCGHELFGLTVWVRVRYVSENYVSKWSDGVTVTLTNDTPADKLRTPLKGGNLEGAYYGNIPHDELVDSYRYRGPYQLLFDNNIKTFSKGHQVSHRDKLWYAKVNMDSGSVREPGTNPDLWIEDTRENLPSMRLFIDDFGLGLGGTYADNNADGYSTGQSQLGEMTNKTIGWNKYIYKGRVLYVATEPVCGSICWNDVAKREGVYGIRTIRYGSRYYRIRLLTEYEYNVLLKDMSATDKEYSTLLQRKNNELIEDWREGSKRSAMSLVSGTWKKVDVDPKSRTCHYRPVLELIASGSEPFHHWTKGAGYTKKETLEFDKYTDTGILGQVSNSSFITYEKLALETGLTHGTLINNDAGYIKFYWHGMVLLVSEKPARLGITPTTVESQTKASYRTDLGHGDLKKINFDGKYYIPGLINVWRYIPGATSATAIGSHQTEWGELMMRVTQGFVNDTKGNDYNSLLGHQIGNNWSKLTIPLANHSGNNSYEHYGTPIQSHVGYNHGTLNSLGVPNDSGGSGDNVITYSILVKDENYLRTKGINVDNYLSTKKKKSSKIIGYDAKFKTVHYQVDVQEQYQVQVPQTRYRTVTRQRTVTRHRRRPIMKKNFWGQWYGNLGQNGYYYEPYEEIEHYQEQEPYTVMVPETRTRTRKEDRTKTVFDKYVPIYE